MNITYYHRRRTGGGAVEPPNNYDPDYQAVLDRALALGYQQPTSSVRDSQNQLMIDIKAANLLSKLDMLHIAFHDGDVRFSGINWADPNSYLVDFSTWVMRNTGIAQGVDNIDLFTGYTPSVNGVKFTLSDLAWGFKMGELETGNVVSSGDYVMAALGGTYDLSNTFGTNNAIRANGTFTQVSNSGRNPRDDNAFTIFSIDSGNNFRYYRNGALSIANNPNPTTNLSDSEVKYGIGEFANSMQLFFIGESFTTAEASDFNTAMNTYVSAI